jgi:hypothetical protein
VRGERVVGQLAPHCAVLVNNGQVTQGCSVCVTGTLSNGAIEVSELRLVRAAHDSVKQTPLSALRTDSINWETTVFVVSVGEVEESGSARLQFVQLRDSSNSWSSTRAVLFGSVIESHGHLLQKSRTYKIRGARLQAPMIVGGGAQVELVITERTSIRALPEAPISNEIHASALVPFDRLALCQQSSAVDIAGVVVELSAGYTARLVDCSKYALNLTLAPLLYRKVRVGTVLAVKRAHVSHVDGDTAVLAPIELDRYAIDLPDIVAKLRTVAESIAIAAAESGTAAAESGAAAAESGATAQRQFKDINSVNEKTLAQVLSVAPHSGEHLCVVRIVSVAHDSPRSWSYEGCPQTRRGKCRCAVCRHGAITQRFFKLQLQVRDVYAAESGPLETLTVFGVAALQLMSGKTPSELLLSGSSDPLRQLVGACYALTLTKVATTNLLNVIDAMHIEL